MKVHLHTFLNLDTWRGGVTCSRPGPYARYPPHRSRNKSGHCVCRGSFILLTRILYYTILRLLTNARLRQRRWLQLHNVPQSVRDCLQLNQVHTVLSLEFKLFNSHFNCLICNCATAVKSDEHLPGVSWRRAFNSSFDVWPLLLLSTSDTPESAGLGGREPGTRKHI